jgi:hypothetical protein
VISVARNETESGAFHSDGPAAIFQVIREIDAFSKKLFTREIALPM